VDEADTAQPKGTNSRLLIRSQKLAHPLPHEYTLTERAVLQARVHGGGSAYRLVHGLGMIGPRSYPPGTGLDAGQRAGIVRQVQYGARRPSTIRAPQRSTTTAAGWSWSSTSSGSGPCGPATAVLEPGADRRSLETASTAGARSKPVGCLVDLPCRHGLAAVDITVVFEGPVRGRLARETLLSLSPDPVRYVDPVIVARVAGSTPTKSLVRRH
jgi:hypothetical protein